MQPRVAVVGYSTRSLATSAARLGLHVVAIDAFCDLDTRAVAECVQVESWPQGILDAVDWYSVQGVILGGGMENAPKVVAALSRRTKILGATAQQIEDLRDPRIWQELAHSVKGLSWPRTQFVHPFLAPRSSEPNGGKQVALSSGTPREAGRDHNWLRKRVNGAGGLQVRDVDESLHLANDLHEISISGNDLASTADEYWQERVEGRSLGVSLLIEPEQVLVLGVAESWNTDDWSAPGRYTYRGSYGPVDVLETHRRMLEEFGMRVRERCGYVGLLGADFIESGDRLCLLEINPRWTASLELIEDACHCQPLAGHLRQYGLCLPGVSVSNTHDGVRGKAILYASTDMQWNPAASERWQSLIRRSVTDRVYVARDSGVIPFDETEDAKSFAAGLTTFCTGWLSDTPCVESGKVMFKAGEPVLTLQTWVRLRTATSDGCHKPVTDGLRRVALQGLGHMRHRVMECFDDRFIAMPSREG